MFARLDLLDFGLDFLEFLMLAICCVKNVSNLCHFIFLFFCQNVSKFLAKLCQILNQNLSIVCQNCHACGSLSKLLLVQMEANTQMIKKIVSNVQ